MAQHKAIMYIMKDYMKIMEKFMYILVRNKNKCYQKQKNIYKTLRQKLQ